MLTDPTRSYVLEAGRSLETWLAKRPDLQSWRIRQDLGVKPATPQDEAAWRAAGAPTIWRYPKNMKTEQLFAVPFGSWKEVRAIPSEPEKLRSYLEERITRRLTANSDSAPDVEKVLVQACEDIISGVPASPEARASAYRILASMPGIRAEGEVTDPLGRRGQALSYQSEIEPGLFTHVLLVVDPSAGLLLAHVTTNTTRLANGRQAELRVSASYQAIGWYEERPELPTHCVQGPASRRRRRTRCGTPKHTDRVWPIRHDRPSEHHCRQDAAGSYMVRRGLPERVGVQGG
ncbi:hypothetical protein [Nonomuraea lactucae]|uniref:hypothetical protein n=1 Tax=Nonomuraea lactucae TaxID=2249762 RepID=UPI0013B417F0|nr:hypothetical protein [Nonomuraea lactucae]